MTAMSVEQLLAAAAPPLRLLPGPTPLHLLPRVSEELGREIWMKRDDLTAVGLGGNKIRKLEHLLPEAISAGADLVVTVGAGQSNHCRATASAARMLGLDCHLVLAGNEPDEATGNLLLDELVGATRQFCGSADWAQVYEQAVAAAVFLREQGRVPYLIPAGGSTPLGSLGYIGAFAELIGQAHRVGCEPSAIVHANGSGGTQAGLVAGASLLGSTTQIVGVAVAMDPELMAPLTEGLADGAIALVAGAGSKIRRAPAVVLAGYRGPHYGVPTKAGAEAFDLVLRREGILLDQVYSAKAFAALLANDPAIPEGPVVFWHTGGGPSVFARA